MTIAIEQKREKKILPVIKEILLYYECKHCSECCTDCTPLLLDDELMLYMKLYGPSFLDMLDDNCDMNILKAPCGFLENKLCRIHANKPYVCAVYPFSFKIPGMVTLWMCPMGKEIIKEITAFKDEYILKHGIKVTSKFHQEMEARDKELKNLSDEICDAVNFPHPAKSLEYARIPDNLLTKFCKHLKQRGQQVYSDRGKSVCG